MLDVDGTSVRLACVRVELLDRDRKIFFDIKCPTFDDDLDFCIAPLFDALITVEVEEFDGVGEFDWLLVL